MKRIDKSLKEKSVEELNIILKKEKGELSRAELEKTLKKEKNVHAVKRKKKEIARIKTIIRQKSV